MSSYSTGPTCPLVLSVIDDTNNIRGTDFGFPKGEWVGARSIWPSQHRMLAS